MALNNWPDAVRLLLLTHGEIGTYEGLPVDSRSNPQWDISLEATYRSATVNGLTSLAHSLTSRKRLAIMV